MCPELVKRISDYRPVIIEEPGNLLASVALVVRQVAGDPEILFIERATHESDPWSGQIAFPGGGKEDQDQDVISAACRETYEEVGLKLSLESYLGRIDDLRGSQRNRQLPLIISCFVFELQTTQTLRCNYEVADAFWVPVSHLADPVNRIEHQTGFRQQPYPAVSLDQDRVLWGLTYRFVEKFLALIP